MDNIIKFYTALAVLKANTECSFSGEINSEDDFNNIEWKTGVDANGVTISTTTCPHSEITWTKLKTEMDKL
tara:strand:+ start:279 stop:491 length:213 start_codon:yes stop_codon:yes gene_type:complete